MTLKYICLISCAMTALYTSDVLASKLKIINNTDNIVKVYVRGKGAESYHIEAINSNSTMGYEISPHHLENKQVYEVIASTGKGKSPDWRLLSGVCSNLETTGNHTLLIEKTMGGLKTSCEKLID